MKPFDLQKAKAGAPICSADGQDAKFIAHDLSVQGEYSVIAVSRGKICIFSTKGRKRGERFDSVWNLFMKPKENIGWIALFFTDEELRPSVSSTLYATSEEAHDALKDFRHIVARIKWEEE